MADKPRGNVLYEICIVILVVALIATILYPSKVWQNEGELEAVCQARMDAIHQMEFRYIAIAESFTDSIPVLKEVVFNDPSYVMALDSVIFWDGLVTQENLKEILDQRQFPEDLRVSIRERLLGAMPLGNLGNWDSLIYRLIRDVQPMISAEMEETVSIDTSVNWFAAMGETAFWNILENADVSRTIRSRMRSHVQRGRAVNTSTYWDRFKPAFYDALNQKMATAMREDIWTKVEQDQWEEDARVSWEEEMDAYSQTDRDSLWSTLQRRVWDKEKELLWKKERRPLYKAEGEAWKAENEALWNRAISQQWQSERKKAWTDEQMSALSGSEMEFFRAKKDSMWRSIVDSLRENEYEGWLQSNKKRVDEVIYNLWEVGRRLTWEDDAQIAWLEEKNTDPEVLWTSIKEEIWNAEKGSFWRDEEAKLGRKMGALRTLDRSIAWIGLLGADRIIALVDGLELPNNQGFWKHIHKADVEEGSPLYQSGVTDLFRETLLESVGSCPLTETSYLITVNDTATIKKIEIRCPIVQHEGEMMALVIDPVTLDSTYADLGIPPMQKILGGSAVKNHGFIDEDQKKSWVKRGR